MSLPRAHTTVVLAMSADGKIADCDRTPARFSSPDDLSHLETEIAKSDATLFGAGTLRAYGTCLPVRQSALLKQRRARQKPEQPIQIVCSRSGELDSNWRFFRQPVPRWLLTTQQGGKAWESARAFDQILYWPMESVNWAEMLQRFFSLGIQRIVVLGGGTLVSGLIQADLIDELHLTICPLLLGGKTAPTVADGSGLPVDLALRLQLIQSQILNDEVFLHYRRSHVG